MVVFATETYRMNAQSGSVAPPAPAAPTAMAVTNAPPSALPEQPAAVSPNAFANLTATRGDTNELRLNFRGVPLDMVLNYLSEAAGFIIVMDTQVSGSMDVWSDRPVTKDEAVNLLNSALNKNGYAAIRNGRTLTIMTKEDAKTRDIPVKIGNDPNLIPNNDEMVTQIIPVRYVQAKQLATDLSPFVSSQATIVANEAGNSIVVTDTQSNIRHLVQIIEAIDNSAQGETEIRVFPLKHANPSDVATELGQIFPSNSSGTGQTQAPIRFGGGGPGGFFARMAAQAADANNQSSAIQKQSQVIAVADARTQSVIVSASKDLMDQIAGMMEQLDVSSPRDQKVFVFHMNNGDPQQALQVLQNMFQSTSGTSASSTSSSSQNSALQNRAIQNATSMGSSSSSSTTSGFGGSNNRGIGGSGTQNF